MICLDDSRRYLKTVTDTHDRYTESEDVRVDSGRVLVVNRVRRSG